MKLFDKVQALEAVAGMGTLTMSPLSDDIATYEAMQASLEAEHLGKWALVYDRKLIDIFPDFEAAAASAVKQFGRGPFLIRQIGSPPVTLPASVMYRPLHATDPLRI